METRQPEAGRADVAEGADVPLGDSYKALFTGQLSSIFGDRINSILTVTQLVLLFKDFDTEEEAVAFLQAKADAEKGGAAANG